MAAAVAVAVAAPELRAAGGAEFQAERPGRERLRCRAGRISCLAGGLVCSGQCGGRAFTRVGGGAAGVKGFTLGGKGRFRGRGSTLSGRL